MEMLVIAVVAVAAFAIVLIPLLRRGGGGAADEREFETGPAPGAVAVDRPVPPLAAGPATPVAPAVTPRDDVERPHDDVEAEVLRYRAALRSGTLCPRCGEANPAGSAYCSDCGRRLPLADAQEFE